MVADTVARLRELAELLPRPGCEWEERPTFAPPSSVDAVDELERVAGFTLPQELRAFFAVTDGIHGMSVHNGYQIGGVELLTDLIRTGNSSGAMPDGLAIPVAFDGGGNSFHLCSTGRVWRQDHETSGVIKVAAAFGVFLERIVADWTAYVNDTPGWVYLV